MGKQVVAAIVSVLLVFFVPLLPVAGLFAGFASVGEKSPQYASVLGGALRTAVMFAMLAGVASFMALLYLKLHYGTIGLLVFSVVLSSVFYFSQFPLGSALFASAVSLLLTGSVIFGLLQMLKWVYAKPEVTASVTEEF